LPVLSYIKGKATLPDRSFLFPSPPTGPPPPPPPPPPTYNLLFRNLAFTQQLLFPTNSRFLLPPHKTKTFFFFPAFRIAFHFGKKKHNNPPLFFLGQPLFSLFFPPPPRMLRTPSFHGSTRNLFRDQRGGFLSCYMAVPSVLFSGTRWK